MVPDPIVYQGNQFVPWSEGFWEDKKLAAALSGLGTDVNSFKKKIIDARAGGRKQLTPEKDFGISKDLGEDYTFLEELLKQYLGEVPVVRPQVFKGMRTEASIYDDPAVKGAVPGPTGYIR